MLKQDNLKRVLRRLEKMEDVNAPLQTDFNFRPLTEREKKAFKTRSRAKPLAGKEGSLDQPEQASSIIAGGRDGGASVDSEVENIVTFITSPQ